MATFITHPSVRIKGTENNYTPLTCTDITCVYRQNIHWHCPFCSRHESFADVVILKAHYRVKHVDKGIDFAGLKVLRCCDTCDIVGAIKGEKKFKGAHWHCYRCRNGFNRRDEAIKHYRTHFRNPQTTFQIQIAQEVHQPNIYQEIETRISASNLECEEGLHNVMHGGSTPYTVDMSMDHHHKPMGEMQVSVAANETVNSTPQALMLIQGGNLIQNNNDNQLNQVSTNESGDFCDNGDKTSDSDKRYCDLMAKYKEVVEDKARLTMSIEELKLEMQVHMQEVARYQKREEELLNQLSIPLDKGIQDILRQLESQHRELLYHQLAHIKRTFPLLVEKNGEKRGQENGEEPEDDGSLVDSNDDEDMPDIGCGKQAKDGADEKGRVEPNESQKSGDCSKEMSQDSDKSDKGSQGSDGKRERGKKRKDAKDMTRLKSAKEMLMDMPISRCNGEKHGADDEELSDDLPMSRSSKRRRVS